MGKAEEQRDLEQQKPIESKTIFEGKIINLQIDYLHLEGQEKQIEIVRHPGAVVIIPEINNEIILVRQWRRVVDKIIYELPAGTLEEKEEPLTCAKREIQEEIGYKAGHMKLLGGLYSAPGYCTEYLYVYHATNLQESSLQEDLDEGMDNVQLSKQQIYSMIKSHEIEDAKTIAAFMMHQLEERGK
ncbi:MAG: hypothetical protein COT84_03365 [Chlamydiae bacterium CG10_big_fil_rev_8_21_14_0_10_35_9]|nr:MAG: hypothetical protein COT84_03365 [Chlamydiae bacterium CG10_big_fil_rev_8_21_14_0_10_35_9]